ncbi:Homeodomain-like protein, partial [Linnemannia elongata]
MDDEFYAVKAKRKRANASQLSVLNAAFERSYFPSTEERLRLSKQCRMCPRTVQIWFQNKRQSVKARSEA